MPHPVTRTIPGAEPDHDVVGRLRANDVSFRLHRHANSRNHKPSAKTAGAARPSRSGELWLARPMRGKIPCQDSSLMRSQRAPAAVAHRQILPHGTDYDKASYRGSPIKCSPPSNQAMTHRTALGLPPRLRRLCHHSTTGSSIRPSSRTSQKVRSLLPCRRREGGSMARRGC